MAIVSPISVVKTSDPKEVRKWMEKVSARISYQSYAGDPTNNILPRWQGDMCFDSTNTAWYKSSSEAIGSWLKITP